MAASNSGWLETHPEFGRTPDGSALLLTGNKSAVLTSDVPGPLELHPRAGVLKLSLGGHNVPDCTVGVGGIALAGPGHIGRIRAAGGGGCLLRLSAGVEVGQIDASGSPGLEIDADAESTVKLVLSGKKLVTRGGTQLQAVRVPGGRLESSTFACDVLEAPGELVLVGGGISVNKLCSSSVHLEDKELRIEGETYLPELRLSASSMVIVAGPGSLLEGTNFTGSSGRVIVAGGRLVRPNFDGGDPVQLEVEGGGEVEQASGTLILSISDGSVTGDDGAGISIVQRLTVGEGGGAVDNLDFFKLSPALLASLESLRRVSAWWPKRRKVAVDRAREVTLGLRSPSTQLVARAHYWASVERLLEAKQAGGADLAVAHQVAQDAQRRAAPPRSVARSLLELSRLVGYSALIARPLLLWAAVALAAAATTRRLVNEPCVPGCSVSSWIELYWDTLVSPVTWLRSLGEGSVLQALSDQHVAARIVTFVARLFGTFTVAAAALAIRRYLRPGR